MPYVDLSTERLLLRPFIRSDSHQMFLNWANDDDVTKFLTWKTHSSVEETERVIADWLNQYDQNPNFYHWAIVLKKSQQVIGSISLMNVNEIRKSCEFGICISKQNWGEKIAFEASIVVIQYAMETLNFVRIEAHHHCDNLPSKKLLSKIGFEFEGILNNFIKDRDQNLVDVLLYSYTKKIQNRKTISPCSNHRDKSHFMNVMNNNWYELLIELQDRITIATYQFFHSMKYVTLHLPITTHAVSSPMGRGSDSLPVEVNLFDIPTFLSDSMQFMLEYGCRIAKKNTYYIMPSFRGEKTDHRHLAQFYHSETEISGDLDDIIDVAEQYVIYLSKDILFNCGHQLKHYHINIEHISKMAFCQTSFPRVKFNDAIKILKGICKSDQLEASMFINEMDGYRTLTHLGEKKLMEQFNGVVWLTNFDILSVPFYQREDKANPGTAKNADLLMGIGETIGAGERCATGDEVYSSLRLHQVDSANYEWYIKMKDQVYKRTSGFGMGVERFLMWVLSENDIRDFQILPRENGIILIP